MVVHVTYDDYHTILSFRDGMVITIDATKAAKMAGWATVTANRPLEVEDLIVEEA